MVMINGFNEISQNEMMEVDGGVAIIPVIVGIGKGVAAAAKAVYATPIGKKAINVLVEGAAVAVGGFIANEILDWID